MPVEAPPAPPATAPSAPPTPPPPVKPAPPSAPAKPASTAKNAAPVTTSQPVSEPADNFDDAIFKLGQVADKQAQPAPIKGEEATPEKQEGEPEKRGDGEPEPGKAEVKPAPVKAGTLRENYDRVKTENAELQKQLAAAREEKNKAPADDPEKKKLSETLTEREKRLAELEEEIRFSNYERSQEYKDEYWKPFEEAYREGAGAVASLKITDPETGQLRQATAEDFDAIMRIRDENAAAEAIEALFGTGVKAQIVTDARRHAERLNQKRLNALEDHRKNGAERERLRRDTATEAFKKITEEATSLWQRHKTAPYEKHPLFFKPIEGDEAGNKLLEDGFKEADEAFSNMNPLDPRLTADQRETILKRHALAYNKMAAFNRLAHLFKQERSLRMAIEKKLKDFENSEPGPGDGAGGGAPAKDTMGQAVADLNKYLGR